VIQYARAKAFVHGKYDEVAPTCQFSKNMVLGWHQVIVVVLGKVLFNDCELTVELMKSSFCVMADNGRVLVGRMVQ
jgi:hypothetical protein